MGAAYNSKAYRRNPLVYRQIARAWWPDIGIGGARLPIAEMASSRVLAPSAAIVSQIRGKASQGDHGWQFCNRQQAGRHLADALRAVESLDPLILALPNGGVPVALAIAGVLSAPLELMLVSKTGTYCHDDLAVRAIAEDGQAGPVTDVDHFARLERLPIRRNLPTGAAQWLSRRAVVVVVDDGIMTGATMLAAVRAIRRRTSAWLILAVPVAPNRILRGLEQEVDQIVCLHAPAEVPSIGQFYQQFPSVHDADVVAMLSELRETNARKIERPR